MSNLPKPAQFNHLGEILTLLGSVSLPGTF